MIKRILYAFFFLVVFCTDGKSATYYVDNAASGRNDGSSWTNAWQSFSDISDLNSGDVVYVSGGTSAKTYTETLTTVAGVTYQVGQSYPHNGQVIIDAQDTRLHCIDLESNVTISGNGSASTYGILCKGSVNDGIRGTAGTNNVTIEYVEIFDAGNERGGDCIQVGDSFGWEISHCYIHQCFQDGINSAGGSATSWGENAIHDSVIKNVCDDGFQAGTGWDIYNNEIGFITMDLDVNPHCVNASGHPDGIQIQRMYYRVWNNVIHDCSTYCLWVSSTQSDGLDGHIRYLNNIVYMSDHDNYGTTVGGIGYAANSNSTTVTDVVIANNTIVDMRGSGAGPGLFLAAGPSATLTDCYVYNNIIYNSSGNSSGFAFEDTRFSSNGGKIDYNIIATDGTHGNTTIKYNGSNISYSTWVTAYGQNQNGSTSEPRFTNYVWEGVTKAADMRLDSSDTAAINKGTLVTGFNFPPGWPFDYGYNARPQGGSWDIGAFEYDGTARDDNPTKKN